MLGYIYIYIYSLLISFLPHRFFPYTFLCLVCPSFSFALIFFWVGHCKIIPLLDHVLHIYYLRRHLKFAVILFSHLTPHSYPLLAWYPMLINLIDPLGDFWLVS